VSIQLINPYYRGIGDVVVPPEPAFEFSGVLVTLSVDDVSAPPIGWDVEAYDVGGWHDAVTNIDRLTVPSGVSLVEVAWCGYSAGVQQFYSEIFLDAASMGSAGGIRQLVKTGLSGYTYGGLSSGPHVVTPGQYFTVNYTQASNVLNQSDYSWFAACALDPDTRYVRLGRSSTFTMTAGSTTVVAWNVEVADVGGWADLGVSATDVVVPSGVSWVIGEFGFRVTSPVSTSEQLLAAIRLNGSLVCNRDVEGIGATGETINGCSISSGLLQVSAGDVLTADYFTTGAETFSTLSTFTVREVLDVLGACRATKGSSTQSITANTNTAVELGAEAFDTDAAHDTSVNPSRITVPAGVTRARCWFGVRFQSTTGQTRAWVMKNGASAVGLPAYGNVTAGQNYLTGAGAWVDCSPGDYFELFVRSNVGTTINNDAQTFLCVQFG
jgi:hypothetical protein